MPTSDAEAACALVSPGKRTHDLVSDIVTPAAESAASLPPSGGECRITSVASIPCHTGKDDARLPARLPCGETVELPLRRRVQKVDPALGLQRATAGGSA
jgi:hypothetical protein